MSTLALVRRVQSLETREGVLALRPTPTEPLPLDSPADVLAVLAEQVNAVRADPLADPADKARTLGFLAGVALRALEARDVEARLEAVQRVLKLRKDQERDEQKARKTLARR